MHLLQPPCRGTMTPCRGDPWRHHCKRYPMLEIGHTPSYRKSWSLDTMLAAVFRPEVVLTLFLRMRNENVSKCRVTWCRVNISTTSFHLQKMWAERKTERSGPKTDLSGAGFKKSSGAWAELEREVVGTGTERWAGNIGHSKSAPPQNHPK